ncbi:MAG: hypothetical protein ACJ8DO_09060, partial [Microvirga sp.]
QGWLLAEFDWHRIRCTCRPFAVCDPRRRVSKTIRPRGRVFFERAAHLAEARQLLGDDEIEPNEA